MGSARAWESKAQRAGMTRTHTAAIGAGLLHLLGSILTLFPDLANLLSPAPCNSPMGPVYHLHPTAGLGAPLRWPSRALARVGRGGAALRVTGGGEPPPRPDGGDIQSSLNPRGLLLSLRLEASAPPCSAQPPSLGSEPGQGRGGGVSYRIWGDGVSLPQLRKLLRAVLRGPDPVLPGGRTEQTASPLGLPG